MIFILISGKAGVGKSTLAKFLYNYLIEKYDVGDIMPFAAEVKDAAKRSFGWDGEKDDKGRKLLQGIGSIGREYNTDLWVERAYKKTREWDFAIMDDWRFPNEVDYLVKKHERVIKIRVESPERELLKGTPLAYDISEISLPSGVHTDYDIVVFNEFTLNDLDLIAKYIVEKMV